MTINGFNSVSGSMTPDYQNTSMPTNPTTQGTSPTIQGIPADTIQIASKSLFAGGTISNQIVKIRNSEVPGEVKGMHSGPSLMKTGKNVAIVSGIVSLARNTYDYIQGNLSGSRLGGNVTSDMVGGLGGGMLAAGAGYLTTMAVGSTFGAGVLGLVVGTAAFAGADLLYRNSGAHQTVSDKVTAFIDSILNRIKPGGGV